MKTFRTSILLLSIPFLISNCSDEPTPVSTGWEKVEIPDGVAIYSMYGNIDDTFLVATIDEIRMTQDRGKTWSKVLKSEYSISEFRKEGNTIFALSNFTDYYSINNGETWEVLNDDLLPTFDFSKETSAGILFKLQFNFEGELANPTSVLISSDKGDHWESVFPYEHLLYSAHLDNTDRVYLGTNDWEWNEQQGSFVSENENKAIFYYSK